MRTKKISALNLLNYLYKNNDGEFKDITSAFKCNSMEDYKKLNSVIKELNEFIEIKENKILLNNAISDNIPKIKISLKGYYHYKDLQFKSLERKLSYRNYVIALLMLLGTLYYFFGPNLREIFTEKKNIPPMVVMIKNETQENKSISYRSGMSIWLPSLNGAPRYDGTVEFVLEEDTLEIPAGESIKVLARILNIDLFYDLFKNGDSDITINLHTADGSLYISDDMPFSQSGFETYYATIVLD